MMQDQALATISRGMGVLAPSRGKPWALIIPASSHGSLGDAAMTIVARDQLRARGMRVCLLADDSWAALEGFDAYVPADPYLFHGGRRTFLELMWRTRAVSAVALIGADILDGVYNPHSVLRRLKILAALARRGCAATILGSSFNQAPNPVCVEALRRLPPSVAIKARDPISLRRMAAHLERPVDLVADLAFLCPTDPANTREALGFIAGARAAGRRVVGLTANFTVAARTPGFKDAHVPLLKAIIGAGHSVVLVPHDTRKSDSDAALLTRIADRLTAEERAHTTQISPDHPARVKAVLGACDLGVTSRMHAAILAMGTGVPAFSFGYQGKFEGLMDLVGLSAAGMLHEPAALVADPQAIADAVLARLAERERLSATLERTLPAVLELSRQNFAPGTPAATATEGAASVAHAA